MEKKTLFTKKNVMESVKRTGKGVATVGRSLASAAQKYNNWQLKMAKQYGGSSKKSRKHTGLINMDLDI